MAEPKNRGAPSALATYRPGSAVPRADRPISKAAVDAQIEEFATNYSTQRNPTVLGEIMPAPDAVRLLPLPLQHRNIDRSGHHDRRRSLLALGLIVLLAVFVAWLSGEVGGAVGPVQTVTADPVDMPTSSGADAIRVVKELIDAANRNDFAVYASMLFEHRIVGANERVGACDNSWCTGEGEPTPAQSRQAARDALTSLHTLGATWTLSNCLASTSTVGLVAGTAIECDLSFQPVDHELSGVPAIVDKAQFRVSAEGVIEYSTFTLPDDDS